jgi:hypothetical protein
VRSPDSSPAGAAAAVIVHGLDRLAMASAVSKPAPANTAVRFGFTIDLSSAKASA